MQESTCYACAFKHIFTCFSSYRHAASQYCSANDEILSNVIARAKRMLTQEFITNEIFTTFIIVLASDALLTLRLQVG